MEVFLNRLEEIVIARAVFTTSNLETLAKKLLKKYFRDLGSLPTPTFKIENNPKSRWLGRCVFDPKKPATTSIKIQKSILGDERTVKRVLAHELIHHVAFMIDPSLTRTDKGHGAFFQKWASKINAIEGPNFVGKKSDETYVEQVDQEFFLLIQLMNSGSLGYSWAQRLSSDQKKLVSKYLKIGGRLFKSKDKRWTSGTTISDSFSIPRAAGQKLLKEIFEHGKRAKI